MTKFSLSSVFLALGGLLVAGCGSSPAGSSSATCEANPGMAGHFCETVSYSGAASSTPLTCPAPSTSVSSCTTANALGTCTYSVSAGPVTETVVATYYSDGGETAMSAQMACTALSGATWQAM
jgi:hypothetical protein